MPTPIDFYDSLDLHFNELKETVLQSDSHANLVAALISTPGAKAGGVGYSTTYNSICWSNGSVIVYPLSSATATDTTSIDMTATMGNGTVAISGSVIVRSGELSIDSSGVGLPNTGTAGTYTKVTTDAKGRVTSGTSLSVSDIPAHASTHKSGGTDTIRLDELALPTNDVSMNSKKITGLATPISSTDAANKQYVDDAVAGLKWKASVKVATTANITLSGTQTIDGIAVSAGDRVLVKDQTTNTGNGIYVANASTWSRATDADAWTEIVSAAVFVEQGSTYADTAWTCTVDTGGTLGSTAITWTQFNGVAALIAGAGLTKTGNTIDVGAGTGITVLADSVGLNSSYISSSKYYVLPTTGWVLAANYYTQTFALNNMSFPTGASYIQEVEVQRYDSTSNRYIRIFPGIQIAADRSSVTIETNLPPLASGATTNGSWLLFITASGV